MAETCETVRVKVAPTEGNPDGVVIINKADQTPEHQVVDPADAMVPEQAPKQEGKADESKADGEADKVNKPAWAPK